MANTYSQIYIHYIFSVKHRECLINKRWRDELYKYISGIVSNKGNKMIAINGVEDHIHMLIGLKSNQSISDIIRDVKNNSSKFINSKNLMLGKFEWQEGYGAFSYSRSQIDSVCKYILNQEEHHKKKTFRDEYIEFLEHFEITFDEKYLLGW